MSLIYEERLSDAPYVQTITRGHTLSAGGSIRPAEIGWHLIFRQHQGRLHPLLVGPWSTSGRATWGADADILWVRFKPGIFMPHLPTRNFLNSETQLPTAADKSFWLNGSAWQFPDYENVDTFINRLIRAQVLVQDTVVTAALQDQLPLMPSRTVRHRFLHATGLTQTRIRQVERAQQAAALLRQGTSILDTVHTAGYFDQPHLTRALKHFIGYTPAQIIRMSQPACHSVQDTSPGLDYDTNVLEKIR